MDTLKVCNLHITADTEGLRWLVPSTTYAVKGIQCYWVTPDKAQPHVVLDSADWRYVVLSTGERFTDVEEAIKAAAVPMAMPPLGC